jgi:LysR family transcriptional regulator, low CO2-responsive transcriptional regulator
VDTVDSPPGTDAEGVGRPQPADILLNPVRLAVFRTVVERRSFARAAEALSLSPSTVSGHIRVLEEVLEGELFDRQRRGAPLTEIGQCVYDFAIGVQRELVALRAQIKDLAEGRVGSVALGGAGVMATRILPEILARFHQEHPNAHLRIRDLTPEQIVNEVQRGGLDFGILSASLPIPPALRTVPLWCETLVLVAAGRHPLSRQTAIRPSDLVGQPFVVGWRRTQGDQALDQDLARAGLPPRRIVMEIGNLDGVREAVRQGVGLGIVFERTAAADLRAGDLAVLPVLGFPMAEQYLLIHRPAHRFTPLAKQLIAFLQAQSA